MVRLGIRRGWPALTPSLVPSSISLPPPCRWQVVLIYASCYREEGFDLGSVEVGSPNPIAIPRPVYLASAFVDGAGPLHPDSGDDYFSTWDPSRLARIALSHSHSSLSRSSGVPVHLALPPHLVQGVSTRPAFRRFEGRRRCFSTWDPLRPVRVGPCTKPCPIPSTVRPACDLRPRPIADVWIMSPIRSRLFSTWDPSRLARPILLPIPPSISCLGPQFDLNGPLEGPEFAGDLMVSA